MMLLALQKRIQKNKKAPPKTKFKLSHLLVGAALLFLLGFALSYFVFFRGHDARGIVRPATLPLDFLEAVAEQEIFNSDTDVYARVAAATAQLETTVKTPAVPSPEQCSARFGLEFVSSWNEDHVDMCNPEQHLNERVDASSSHSSHNDDEPSNFLCFNKLAKASSKTVWSTCSLKNVLLDFTKITPSGCTQNEHETHTCDSEATGLFLSFFAAFSVAACSSPPFASCSGFRMTPGAAVVPCDTQAIKNSLLGHPGTANLHSSNNNNVNVNRPSSRVSSRLAPLGTPSSSSSSFPIASSSLSLVDNPVLKVWMQGVEGGTEAEDLERLCLNNWVEHSVVFVRRRGRGVAASNLYHVQVGISL